MRRRAATLTLRLDNPGAAGAVLHVYDRLHLERGPRRYTVEAGKRLDGIWDTATDGGRYDLWVLGPNGFHRHFAGRLAAGAQAAPDIQVSYDAPGARLRLTLANRASAPSNSISRTPPTGSARRRGALPPAPRRNAIGTSAAWPAGTTAPSR